MSPAVAAALAEPWMIEAGTFSLIETIANRGDIPAELAKAFAEGPKAVVGRQGRPMDQTKAKTTLRDNVATIPVRGPIVRHSSMITEYCGSATVAGIAEDLQAALAAPHVRAIVLEFDSPGGQVTGIAELAHMIAGARGIKPVVAYVDGSACSAAYYLAAACEEVMLSPMGRVGSIGVIQSVPPKDRRPGADSEFVSSQSPMKNPDPGSEAGRSEYQAGVDDLAAIFIEDVAGFRGTSPETVQADFGRGGVKVGAAAVAAKMADRTGSYEALHAELSTGKRPTPVPKPTTRAEARTEPEAGTKMPNLWKRMWAKVDDKGVATELHEDTIDTILQNAVREGAATSKPGTFTLETTETEKALKAEIARLTAQMIGTASAADHAKSAADSFAQAMLATKRIVPAELASLVEDYTMAAQDDATNPITSGLSRVARLKSRTEARPKHSLTEETVGVADLPADAQVLGAIRPQGGTQTPAATEPTPEGEQMSEGRRDHLLSLTEAGRKILAARAKK